MPTYIRALELSDAAAFISAVRLSHTLHTPWVQAPCDEAAFAAYYKRSLQDTHFSYLVCTASGELAGVININEIVRGAFQSGYLGFYALEPYAGQGCMSAGLKCILEEAFTQLGLHRLEANIQPANTASINLVRSNGFRKEGFSPRYLKINNTWQDHERWAITCD